MPGAKVFLDYDQEQLDAAYDQSFYAPNREQVLVRRVVNSDIARAHLGPPLRLQYGPTRCEWLDIYRTHFVPAPVNIFVHGGAWRSRKASEYAFAAEPFVNAGSNFVVLDFINVIEAGGSLFPMVEQVKRAVAWLYHNARSLGFDSDKFYVSGASSGAHLAAVIATTDWAAFGMPPDAIKGFALVSGMYDLLGPRLSKRSAYVRFSDEMEHALSPQRHIGRISAPIVLLVGSLETPEFLRQASEFAQSLEAAQQPVELIVAEGYNHYEISESIGNPYGPAGRAMLRQMALSGPMASGLDATTDGKS